MERNPGGVPNYPAGTLAVIGDLKGMSPRWLRGLSFLGYGATLQVGLGIPIPILNEEIMAYTAVRDRDILTPVTDYSRSYPHREGGNLGMVSYAELNSGSITLNGRRVPTAPLSSIPGAREIALTLKDWIMSGRFLLSRPAAPLPSAGANITVKPLPQRT